MLEAGLSERCGSSSTMRGAKYLREALDGLGLKRYCCRRMVLTHVDLIEKLLCVLDQPEQQLITQALQPSVPSLCSFADLTSIRQARGRLGSHVTLC